MALKPRWIPAILILFVFFTAYVIHIDRTAHYDEMFTFLSYTESLDDIVRYDFPNNHVLHSFLVWVSTSILGTSLIAIRLPAFIASILSLAMVYRVASRWQNPQVGVIAMICMGVTYQFANYSVNARGYTLVIFLTLLVLDIVTKTLPCISVWRTILTLVCSLCLILVVPSTVFLIVTLIVWQLLMFWNSKVVGILFNVFANILAIGIGIGIYIYLLSLVDTEIVLARFANFGYADFGRLVTDTTQFMFSNPAVGVLMLVTFIWGIGIILPAYHKPRFMLIIIIGLGTLLFSILQVAVTQRFFFPRNYAYLLPLLAFISAIGVHSLWRWRLNIVIPVSLLIVGLWGLQTLSKPTTIDQWLNTIDTNIKEGDIIIAGCCIYEPLYYHVSVRKETEFDYIVPSEQSNRIIIIETSNYTASELVDEFEVRQYITSCSEETWNSRKVIACPIVTNS